MSGSQQAAEGGDGASGAPPPDRAELEARAERMGWRPREKYRGPADKWVDADEFVEKAERMLPLLQDRNRHLDRTVQSLQQQLSEQGNTLATLVSSTRRAEQVGYKRALRELQEKRDKAVAEADTATFHAVEREIKELGPEPVADPPPRRTNGAAPNGQGNGAEAPPERNPVVDAWVARNPWFRTSTQANAWAIGFLRELETDDPTATIEENLAEVQAEARRLFPHLFDRAPRRRAAPPPPEGDDGEGDEGEANQRRRAPPQVQRSSQAPARSAAPRSFDAMPAEVRRQFDRQVKMLEGKGKPLTKEEFASYYWEANPE